MRLLVGQSALIDGQGGVATDENGPVNTAISRVRGAETLRDGDIGANVGNGAACAERRGVSRQGTLVDRHRPERINGASEPARVWAFGIVAQSAAIDRQHPVVFDGTAPAYWDLFERSAPESIRHPHG